MAAVGSRQRRPASTCTSQTIVPGRVSSYNQTRSHHVTAKVPRSEWQAVPSNALAHMCTCGAPSAAKLSGSGCRCHRVALTRAVLGLEDAITMDVLFYRRDPDRGWQFKPEVRQYTTAVIGTR
jgi:hypothetical protein